MPQFFYAARDEDGSARSGVLEAPSREAALHSLSEQFDMVIRLERSDVEQFSPLKRRHRISAEELMVLTQQLAAMTEGGVGLPRAFDILAHESRNAATRDTVMDLSSHVRGGGTLAAGLQRHPHIFPRFYSSLVEAGERSGTLPDILQRLSAYLERVEKVRRQVIGALIYPSIVIIFAVCMVLAIMVFGVPQITGVYGQMGRPLPVVTQLFVSFCLGLSRTWYIWFGLVFLASVFLPRLAGTQVGRAVFERFLLSTPPFNGVAQDLAMSRFTHTLATLYASGIRVNEALDLVAAGIGLSAYEKEILKARDRILDGDPLSMALRRGKLFSSLALGMISVGEESGSLDRMLERLADIYETRVEVALRSLVAAMEPILIISMGFMIGGIVFILGLPFLSLSQSLM